MKKLNIIFMIARARHDGFLAAWMGRTNPYVKGTRLWKEFNAGRKIAATGNNYSN